MSTEHYVARLDEVEQKSMHGGSVIGRILLDEQRGGVKNFSFLVNTMKAGLNCAHDTPGHTHEVEHCMYTLTGSGGISIDDRRYELEPNMVVYVPPGAVHYVWADPLEDFTYIVIYAPQGPEKHL